MSETEITNDQELIWIEVAYATPEKQIIKKLQVTKDIDPREAVRLSLIKNDFPEIDLDTIKLGVFGKHIKDGYTLYANDRIELYRSLLADPKEVRRRLAAEVRRRLAAEGKTMGNKK